MSTKKAAKLFLYSLLLIALATILNAPARIADYFGTTYAITELISLLGNLSGLAGGIVWLYILYKYR